MTVPISFDLNGQTTTAEVEPRRLAVHYLRGECGQTGTNVGCDTAQCGACTILLDGLPAKSCNLLAVQLDRRSVTTIEGVTGADGARGSHPMQEAFHQHHGLQCGFCTPGMVLTGIAIAESDEPTTDDSIRHCLEGNLCRCTGYEFIVDSIQSGAERMRSGK